MYILLSEKRVFKSRLMGGAQASTPHQPADVCQEVMDEFSNGSAYVCMPEPPLPPGRGGKRPGGILQTLMPLLMPDNGYSF